VGNFVSLPFYYFFSKNNVNICIVAFYVFFVFFDMSWHSNCL